MTSPDLEALKALVALARKLPKLPFAERDGVQNADFAMATVKALPALERLLASQGKPEAEADRDLKCALIAGVVSIRNADEIMRELYAAVTWLWKDEGNPENWTAATKESIQKYKAGIKKVMRAMEAYENYIK